VHVLTGGASVSARLTFGVPLEYPELDDDWDEEEEEEEEEPTWEGILEASPLPALAPGLKLIVAHDNYEPRYYSGYAVYGLHVATGDWIYGGATVDLSDEAHEARVAEVGELAPQADYHLLVNDGESS
jgi:hypothetical protein